MKRKMTSKQVDIQNRRFDRRQGLKLAERLGFRLQRVNPRDFGRSSGKSFWVFIGPDGQAQDAHGTKQLAEMFMIMEARAVLRRRAGRED